MIELKSPLKAQVEAARLVAGHTQEQAAELVGLSGGIRWSEYERGVRSMDGTRWALYQLMTGQHPEFKLIRRSRKGG